MISAQNTIGLSDHSEPEPHVAVLHARPDYYADTSLEYDRDEKLPRYAEAMIPEVWLIDLDHDTIERYIRPIRRRYAEAVTYQRDEQFTTTLLTPLAVVVNTILG